jgi:hypothetical protein
MPSPAESGWRGPMRTRVTTYPNNFVIRAGPGWLPWRQPQKRGLGLAIADSIPSPD